ncbi:MAG: hypothetical protein AB7G62_18615 [Magnetospirillum sp.]
MKTQTRLLILSWGAFTLLGQPFGAHAMPPRIGSDHAVHDVRTQPVVLTPAGTEIPYLPFEWSYHQPVYQFDAAEDQTPRLLIPVRGPSTQPPPRSQRHI